MFVDPGHGGIDTGTLGSSALTPPEKDLTLATGLDLSSLLRRDGITVLMSRVSDTLVTALLPGDTTKEGTLSPAGLKADLEARVACANEGGAKALIGIHLNAFSDPSVGGVQAIYDPSRSFSASSQRLAAVVSTSVVSSLATAGWSVPARGIASDVGLGSRGLTARSRAYGRLMELGPAYPGYFSHPSQMPGAIAELLFLTNPTEAAIAAGSAGQQALARGLAAGLEAWLLARA